MSLLEERGRGSETDYVLGTHLGWDAFDVVRWRGVEALDELFYYDILLVRDVERGAIDVDSLIDRGATFCIATAARWRLVHGIVSESELVDLTPTRLIYRAVLVPHLARGMHRVRCRTFVEQSLEQIVGAVLENRAPKHPQGLRGLAPLAGEPTQAGAMPAFDTFREPVPFYRWALLDGARTKVPRRFVVQYNESDFDFVSRLLEAEGISYFFEQAQEGPVLTLSDRPGHAPLFERDESHELVGTVAVGSGRDQEVVRSFRSKRRLRPATVTMRDFAWRKSLTTLEASAETPDAEELEHFEFPARDEDEPAAPGKAPAQFQLERFEAERALSSGTSTVRTLEPGYRFRLTDRAGLREPVDLLTVRVESFAAQRSLQGTTLEHEPFGLRPHGPDEPFFENQFETLPAAVRHRPARDTEKPRIFGVQTARVTAEELAKDSPPPELNSDEFSRVRIRFPWDQRPNDGTPTSKWIRVAQYWAGPGFGALYVPRVGHEVLVAFEQGDPDRPIIVGRLYNAQNPPPYPEANATKSTIKSDSVGADGSSADGFNEFRFEDAAGKEQVFLHAQRNLDEVVRASHSTTVGGSQTNTVGGDQTNTVFGSRKHHVHGTEFVKVDGARTTEFGATESHSVASHRVTGIGANDTLAVGADHSVNVSGNQRTEVRATRAVTVGASQTIGVGTSEVYKVGADRSVDVTGHYTEQSGGTYTNVAPKHIFRSGDVTIKAGSATLHLSDGLISLDNGGGARIILAGGLIAVFSGNVMDATGGMRKVTSGGPTVVGAGGACSVDAGGNINATAPLIKMNG